MAAQCTDKGRDRFWPITHMNIPGLQSLAHIKKIWINRSEPEYVPAFAGLYWRTLLFVAVIIIIAVSAYSVILFSSVLSELNSSTSQTSATSTAAVPATLKLNPVLLQSTIETFAARQARFETMQHAPILPVSDPSQ